MVVILQNRTTGRRLLLDKNTIIKSGIYKDFLETKANFYKNGYIDGNKRESYEGLFDKETIDNCFRIYNANRQRKRNGFNELLSWFFTILMIQTNPDNLETEEDQKYVQSFHLIFGTLTFTDKVLKNTSVSTRRRYVARFLNKNTVEYMANIDYGDMKDREHYHFVALVNAKIPKNSWKYGFDYYRNIKASVDELKKAKNYLLKLNNHCYKESTKQARILKSRKWTINNVILLMHEEEFELFKIFMKEKIYA